MFKTKNKASINNDDYFSQEGFNKYLPNNIIEQQEMNLPEPTDYQNHLINIIVGQDQPETEEEVLSIFDLISVLSLFFGFIDGMLNALPEDSLLGDCASDLEDQRTRFTTMYEFIKLERDLSNAVNEAYIGLKYTNSISISCYYGLIVYGFDPT